MNESVRIGHDRLSAEIWTLGASLNDLRVPDRDGVLGPVVLGYADPADRRVAQGYLGEICGPFGNRIANGSFTLDGVTFELDRNEFGKQTLHGGSAGFSSQTWTIAERDDDHVRLALDWHDRAGSHPGPIHVEVTYRITGQELSYVIEATTAAPTVVNPVQHAYFNLSGTMRPVVDHVIQVAADEYIPVDDDLIPLPQSPVSVGDTGFDLRRPLSIAEALAKPELGGGLDHAFVLEGFDPSRRKVRPVATLKHGGSGRRLIVSTDQPAIHIYTGQGLGQDPSVTGPQGEAVPMSGIALETEGYPDAPHRPDFPSTVLRPGEQFRTETVLSFSILN